MSISAVGMGIYFCVLFTKINYPPFTKLNNIFTTFVNQLLTIMNRRLQQFLDAENITQAQFAARIKAAPASVSHILAGRNKPGFEFIQNTIQAFPDLNIEWLINGKGRMYKQPSGQQDSNTLLFPEDDMVLPETPASDNRTDGLSSQGTENTRRESHIRVQDTTPLPDTGFSEAVRFHTQQPDPPVNQRKVRKIMVFYDDGTFQEFQ